jgi:transcriptional regulator with XRE-family HTH domain
LSERAGVSRAQVGALEHGRHMPAADAAIRLSRALGTTVEALFDPAPPAPPARAVDVVRGGRPPEGALVRVGRVAGELVAGVLDPVTVLSTAARADGVVAGGCVRLFAARSPRGS